MKKETTSFHFIKWEIKVCLRKQSNVLLYSKTQIYSLK